MRLVLACGALAIAVAFAFVQCASLGFLREGAVAGSLPQRLPADVTRAAALAIESIAPVGFIELMLAREDLANGRLGEAQTRIDRLPAGRDREALRGHLFALRGDEPAALIAYLSAGDVAAIEQTIARAEQLGDLTRARRLQRVLIDRLDQDPTHHDALAEAWFRMGALDAKAGYVFAAQRSAYWGAALGDFNEAIKLAPLTPKYLLNAGTQALELGREGAARAYFQAAASIDPGNPSAYAGLGEAALLRGERSAARAYYARGRALDPNAAGVHSLGRKLGP